MQTFISNVVVVYSDTDQMGIVHHSNYLKYYETARWHMFRQADVPYKTVEEHGFLLPVVDLNIQYVKPAFYDDKLTIVSSLKRFEGPKLTFEHTMFNNEEQLVNKAAITVAFVLTKTRKPCRPPAIFAEKIRALLAENAIGPGMLMAEVY